MAVGLSPAIFHAKEDCNNSGFGGYCGRFSSGKIGKVISGANCFRGECWSIALENMEIVERTNAMFGLLELLRGGGSSRLAQE
tara:strand:- start:166 stop:414 length:249 start_codon:yes stop_codon:yes gene_type:complete